jgi:hypothetical protein
MGNTIIFFFALFLSVNVWIDKDNDNSGNGMTEYIRVILACLLWSWLYYLSH